MTASLPDPGGTDDHSLSSVASLLTFCQYVFMRTPVDLPDPLFRKAMEEKIRKAERETGKRLKFPLMPSREPGSLELTNAEIDDLSACHAPGPGLCG